ncbi:hypothetical protein GWK47_016791 [Chionoecetes opilio]|uniref:Chitin-binding type-2 domain-containing protein n=1 Tax=Chionoecetes opilio TaxID=41210 RepID=A0A8J5BYW7_CHIOP|nr:hypothetical protein GWK47_016791 [Chionoecetes opilio]
MMAMVVMVMMVVVMVVTQSSASKSPRYQEPCDITEEDPDGDCFWGEAGVDYPVFAYPPATSFSCKDVIPGLYADTEASCQVYHICEKSGAQHPFLCPNGTLFHQEYMVCDLWFNVDCGRATAFYSLNEHIYSGPRQQKLSPAARYQ